jgi:hypothetical protein|tara:strand:+ start:835 stop:1119 length:285 start_codon:yes stop_codon:yes gene_type:complete
MELLLGGLVAGTLTALAFILLIEKSSPKIKKLLLGHYLFTDIVGTALAYIALPVVGLATMVSASTVCILLTTYLYWRRTTIKYITIKDLLFGKN